MLKIGHRPKGLTYGIEEKEALIREAKSSNVRNKEVVISWAHQRNTFNHLAS